MKGISLLSDFFWLLALASATVIMLSAVVFVNYFVGAIVQAEVNVNINYEPVVNENALVAYLESTNLCGKPVKQILGYAIHQLNEIRSGKEIYVDGCLVELDKLSKSLLDRLLIDSYYKLVLRVDGDEILLAKKGFLGPEPEISDFLIFGDEKRYRVLLYSTLVIK